VPSPPSEEQARKPAERTEATKMTEEGKDELMAELLHEPGLKDRFSGARRSLGVATSRR
jgi:hypothetical protein